MILERRRHREVTPDPALEHRAGDGLPEGAARPEQVRVVDALNRFFVSDPLLESQLGCRDGGGGVDRGRRASVGATGDRDPEHEYGESGAVQYFEHAETYIGQAR